MTQVGKVFEQEHPDVPVVLDKGRYLIVRLGEEHRRMDGIDAVCYQMRPLAPRETVLRTVAPPAHASEPWIDPLVGQVSRSSLERYLTRLTDLPTRHSLSAEFTRAAAWARDELERLGFATR